MALFSRLAKIFGGQSEKPAAQPGGTAGKPEIYRDLVIEAEPISEGGQWRLAGRIRETGVDNPRSYQFIRADVFASRDDAIEYAIRKGRQIVDEQGKSVFEP